MQSQLTYLTTFLAYTSVHMMRMSIPFVQLSLMQHFTIEKSEMGLISSLLYIIIGVSYLKQVLFPIENMQFHYLIAMSISAFSFLLIPILVYTKIHTHWFLYLVIYGFGWFQAIAWPVLLKLVHAYFVPNQNGCLLGFWAANTSVGNIAGFALCTWLIYFMKLAFQVPLIVSAVISILTTISVYKLPTPEPVSSHKAQPPSVCESLSEYLSLLKTPIIALTLLIMCMLKSILYGILLWLPMYFAKQGFKQYEGYIPIAMNIAAVIGSIVLGFVYSRIHNKYLRTFVFFWTLVLTTIIFYLIQRIEFSVDNKSILLILISIIGFNIMGNFNILSTHEITSICEQNNKQITTFSSLSMGVSSLWTGIVQLIIGFIATENSNSVFLVFFLMSIAIIVLKLVRVAIYWTTPSQQEESGKGHQSSL